MVETQRRITLWGIEIFAAVAETGSISAAARRVGASPSAVSQQISGLESALGVRLLDRGARPLALTAAGRMFARRVRRILDEAERARAELASRDLVRLDRFRLGVIEDFDSDVTPRLLAQMAGALTGCAFTLRTGASHNLAEALEARALDVVVAAAPDPAAPWMEVHPLLSDPFVAVVPRAWHAALEAAPAGFAERPLIRYTEAHLMGRQIAAHLAASGAGFGGRFEMDSYHAILAMVAEEAGWAILTPLGALSAQRFAGQVDLLPLPLPPLARRIAVVARQGGLGGIPADTADRLRAILAETVVAPARRRFPFLDPAFAVLPPQAAA